MIDNEYADRLAPVVTSIRLESVFPDPEQEPKSISTAYMPPWVTLTEGPVSDKGVPLRYQLY
mgnify:CR=1 FL=1